MNEEEFQRICKRLIEASQERMMAQGYLAPADFRLARMAKNVGRLSQMFNGQSPMKPRYMDDDRLRSAYISYYLYPNMLKTIHVLEELQTYAPDLFSEDCAMLDIGCGPGTSILGTLLHLAESGHGQLAVTGVDRSGKVLRDLVLFHQDLARELQMSDRTTLVTKKRLTTKKKFNLVFISNALEEFGMHHLWKLLDHHLDDQGYAVIIQPALRDVTQRMMAEIETATSLGYTIAAPCLAVRACPMRAIPKMWCHEDRIWIRPPWIQEMDARAGLKKDSLKYSYLVLTRQGKGLSDIMSRSQERIVSSIHKEKGKTWAYCCPMGGAKLEKRQFLNRHRKLDYVASKERRRGLIITPN